MTSQATTYSQQTFTSLGEGGAGIIGVSGNSPSLQATIQGKLFEDDIKDLYAYLHVLQSGQTTSVNNHQNVYSNLAYGGVGITALTTTVPDLIGIYTPFVGPRSSSSDLIGVIRAIHSGNYDLRGYIRSAESGSLDLQAEYLAFHSFDLPAFIRPTVSSMFDLNAEIEPIPPVDLDAMIDGVYESTISATLEAVVPVDLSATISGQQFLDLYATYSGAYQAGLPASYSGAYPFDLHGIIQATTSATATINAMYHGFLGINETDGLSGYIIPTFSGNLSLTGTIVGVSLSNLLANYSPFVFEDLPVILSGILPEGALEASISPTGSYLDLRAYLLGNSYSNSILNSYVDGTDLLDLMAEINAGPQNTLNAEISSTGINSNLLLATVSGYYESFLSGSYTSKLPGILDANIISIEAPTLNATIKPKVFYIDSSILINTYPIKDLRVVINGYDCGISSSLSDLAVFIKGIAGLNLEAQIIGLAGQYAIAVDELPIIFKEKIISEDWIFIITEQPAIATDKIQLIFTNSPFSDLSATIIGLQQNTDLTANIQPVYVSPVTRDGVPIGQWLNTKTGETKVVRLFFRGSADNFYYSADADTTYNEEANDSLIIVIETYKTIDAGENSPLTLKTDVKECTVDNLSGFASIDDAIKYAIACSVFELNGQLGATITAIGQYNDLTTSISGETDLHQKQLLASVNAVTNQPIISGTYIATGGFLDLNSYIFPVSAQVTSTPFLDVNGDRYQPQLVVNLDGSYSVILVQIPLLDTIDVTSPDLYTTITGFAAYDLGATISGV